MANFQNSISTVAPVSIYKSACSPAGIMSPGLGPAELLRNCLLDWAPSGANKKRPPGLGPGSFPKKLQWGPVFLCQIEYGCCATWRPAAALLGWSKLLMMALVFATFAYFPSTSLLPQYRYTCDTCHVARVVTILLCVTRDHVTRRPGPDCPPLVRARARDTARTTATATLRACTEGWGHFPELRIMVREEVILSSMSR